MTLTPTARRALASGAVGVAGLAALVFALREPPSPLDGAARWVRAHARRGDVVLAASCAAPEDADRFAPVHAVCADGRAVPLALLARFPRVLLAGESPTLRTLLGARFGAATRGAAGVRVLRTSPAPFDLRAAIARATVTRGGTVCPRRGDRHVCAGPAWRTVEPREVTIGDQRVECVFAHPSEDGLAIEVPLPPGIARVRGVAGLSDRAAARRKGPPVSLRVLLDRRAAAGVELPNRKGLRAWDATSQPPASRLRLELATSSQGARSFCLQAWGD